jgi:hypothetical protein
LNSAAIPLLRQMLHRRGESFLEDIEGWLSEREAPGETEAVRAGVMVQLFVDQAPGSAEKPGELKDD